MLADHLIQVSLRIPVKRSMPGCRTLEFRPMPEKNPTRVPRRTLAHRTLAPRTLAPRTLAPRTLAPRTLVPRTLVRQILALSMLVRRQTRALGTIRRAERGVRFTRFGAAPQTQVSLFQAANFRRIWREGRGRLDFRNSQAFKGLRRMGS